LSNLTVYSVSPVGLETVTPSARASSPTRTVRAGPLDAIVRTPGDAVTESIRSNVDRESSLHILPDLTGGRTVSNNNDPAGEMPEIFAESDAYYLLGFEPADPHADARLRRIEVKVDRSGANVRSREGYYVVSPDETPGPAGPDALPAPLAHAVGGVLPARGWPLAISAVPIAGSDLSKPVILVTLGLRQPVEATSAAAAATSRSRSQTDRVEVLTGLLDRFARQRGGDRKTVDVTFDASRANEVQYEIFSSVPAKPGSYEVRVGASMAASPAQSGSVFAFVDVPNFAKDPLSMSGMVLDASPTRLSAPRDLVTAVLPVLPTTAREFASQDRVGAFVRIYQGGAPVCRPIQIAARIVDGTGRVVFDQTIPFGSERFAVNHSADYRVDLPLARLTPGEHLLTVEATSTDKHTVKKEAIFSVR
jgi:hypothetical protein